MNQTTSTLGEICDRTKGIIITGPFGSQLHESDYIEEGIPVIMPKDIIGGKISEENIARIRESDAVRLAKYRLKTGDIVFGRRGDIGRRAIISQKENGWLCGTGSLLIRPGNSIIDPKFLYYYLGEETCIAWISNQAIGATLPNLNTSIMKRISLTYPPLPAQQKIATILSAYDDLIENNTRRVRILEKMAQALYLEWFVNFHFPGHEGVRRVESELGMVPEGWEVSTIGKISNVILGYAFRSKDWCDQGIPVIKIKNIRPRNLIDVDQVDHISEATLSSKQEKYWISHGDILIAMTGATAGKVGKLRSNERMLLNQRVAKIESQVQFKEYLWCSISTPEAEKKFHALADGVAQPNMSGIQIENTKIMLPSFDLLKQFNEFVYPMLNSIDNFILKDQVLRRTRDLLLPKLISGEIDVSDLDIRIPEAEA